MPVGVASMSFLPMESSTDSLRIYSFIISGEIIHAAVAE